MAPSAGLGVEYFRENSEQILADLKTHGCLWFRGFDLMKDEAGFRDWYEAVGLDPCLDPIHSSGLRKFLSKKDAMYEEVNKQSLRGHYIGLHNESTDQSGIHGRAETPLEDTVFAGAVHWYRLMVPHDNLDIRINVTELGPQHTSSVRVLTAWDRPPHEDYMDTVDVREREAGLEHPEEEVGA